MYISIRSLSPFILSTYISLPLVFVNVFSLINVSLFVNSSEIAESSNNALGERLPFINFAKKERKRLKMIIKQIVFFMLIPEDSIVIITFEEDCFPSPIIKDKRNAIGRTKPIVPGINKRKILKVSPLNPNLRKDKQSSIVIRKRKKTQPRRKTIPISLIRYL